MVDGKETKIPFFFEAIYVFDGKETVVHEEVEQVKFSYPKTQYYKKKYREKSKKEAQVGVNGNEESDKLENDKEFTNNVLFDEEPDAAVPKVEEDVQPMYVEEVSDQIPVTEGQQQTSDL